MNYKQLSFKKSKLVVWTRVVNAYLWEEEEKIEAEETIGIKFKRSVLFGA